LTPLDTPIDAYLFTLIAAYGYAPPMISRHVRQDMPMRLPRYAAA